MCMKDVEVQPDRLNQRFAAMEPKSWPSYGQYRKPRVVIPTASSMDEEFTLSSPPQMPRSITDAKSGQGQIWYIDPLLENSLQISAHVNDLFQKGAAESSPRLAHDFPTPPLSPEACVSDPRMAVNWLSADQGETFENDQESVFWQESSECPTSLSANHDGSTFNLDIVTRLRSLKLSGYIIGERVRVRCNRSKWHQAEVLKVTEESIRLWVAAAKSTVDVPVQLLQTHLAKEVAALPASPDTPQGTVHSPSSTDTPLSSSPRSTTTTSSERSVGRVLGSFREEPRAPSYVKSPVHAVRPAHLSHRQLYQQISSAGSCTICQLPMLRGAALSSWGCGHKTHFACVEARFRQGLMECAGCLTNNLSEGSVNGRNDAQDCAVPTFLCVCGQSCSMKDMNEDLRSVGRLCCPYCQYDPWSTMASWGLQRSNSSLATCSPRSIPLGRSSSGGFFDSDIAFARAGFPGSSPPSLPSFAMASPSPSFSTRPRYSTGIRGKHDQELLDSIRAASCTSPTQQSGSSSAVRSRFSEGGVRRAGLTVAMSPRRSSSQEASNGSPGYLSSADNNRSSEAAKAKVMRRRTFSAGEDLGDAVGALPVFRPHHRRRNTCPSVADFKHGMDYSMEQASPEHTAIHQKRLGIPPRSGECHNGSVTASGQSRSTVSGRSGPLRRTVSLDTPGETRVGKKPLSIGDRTAGPPSVGSLWEQLRSGSGAVSGETSMEGAKTLYRNLFLENPTPKSEVQDEGLTRNPWAGAGQWISVVKDGKDVRPKDLEFERMAAFKEGNLGKEAPQPGKKTKSKDQWVLPLRKE